MTKPALSLASLVALLAALLSATAATGQAPYNPAPECTATTNTIVGTEGDDTLKGTTMNDLIVAFGGNDRADGGKAG